MMNAVSKEGVARGPYWFDSKRKLYVGRGFFFYAHMGGNLDQDVSREISRRKSNKTKNLWLVPGSRVDRDGRNIVVIQNEAFPIAAVIEASWIRALSAFTSKRAIGPYTFRTEEEAIQWETAINASIAIIPVPKYLFRRYQAVSPIELEIMTHYIWKVMLSHGNSLLELIFGNIVMGTDTNGLPDESAEGEGCLAIFERVLDNLFRGPMGLLDDKQQLSQCDTIAYTLMRLSSYDVLDRAVLLFFRISPDCLDILNQPGARKLLVGSSNAFKLVEFVLKSLPADQQIRDAMVMLLTGMDPRPATSSVDWAYETKWFEDQNRVRRNRPMDLTLDQLKSIESNPLNWLVIVLYDIKDRQSQGENTLSKLSDALSRIPHAKFLEEFDTADRGIAPHFINFLLHVDRSKDRLKIVRGLINRGQSTGNMFRAVLRAGLADKSRLEMSRQALVEMLFESQFSAKSYFDHDKLKAVNNVPQIIVEEIYQHILSPDANGETRDDDRVTYCFLLTLVFRLEGCFKRGVRSVTTLSQLIESERNIRDLAERQISYSGKTKTLFGAVWIEDYLYRTIERLMSDVFNGDQSLPAPPRRSVNGSSHTELGPPMPPKPPMLGMLGRADSLSPEELELQRDGYSKENMEDLILGFFAVSVASSNLTPFREFIKLLERCELTFFNTFMSPKFSMRPAFIDIIIDITRPSTYCATLMAEDIVLNEVRHFDEQAFDLIALSSERNTQMFASLITVALKLKGYDNLRSRVDSLANHLQNAQGLKGELAQRLLDEVMKRSVSELEQFRIEEVQECVSNGLSAVALLSGTSRKTESEKLKQMLFRYIESKEPKGWVGLFIGAKTIALFIKYMSREDLPLAYQRFEEFNVGGEILSLLAKVKSQFSSPVLTKADTEMIIGSGGSDTPATVERLIQGVKDRAAAVSNKLKPVLLMSAEWMSKMYKDLSIPMAPRNTQVITVLTFASWVEDTLKNGGTKDKALIAQVGTGEGKSLVIAMLAIFFAKQLKKKVHILENNGTLLGKDSTQFEEFYRSQGVSMTTYFQNPNAQVCYTLRINQEGAGDMEEFYKKKIVGGTPPFADTILIVDEVDELIVDDAPNQTYVKGQTGSNEQLSRCYKRLQSNSMIRPNDIDEFVWNYAVSGFDGAKSKVAGRDYQHSGDNLYYMDSGVLKKRTTTPWLTYLRHEKGQQVQLDSFYYHQSMPHMMSQYEAILGLSGSLGSKSEKEFLRETYGAKTFKTPSFLVTCEGFRKDPPVLVAGEVQLWSRESDQIKSIVDLAVGKCADVPVLIVTPDSQTAVRVAEAIKKALKPKQSALKFPPEQICQLFLRYEPGTSTEMNHKDIVSKATAILEGGGANCHTRRITVTDPYGGRGHDFQLFDEYADDKGGLLVIATNIPPSERDWVQWKGRTSRSDRKGQYAVVLCEDQEPWHGLDGAEKARLEKDMKGAATGGCKRFGEGLIEELLSHRNAAKEKEIKENAKSILSGQLGNELCDRYYAKFKRPENGPWPCPEHPQDLLFRGFLKNNGGSFTAENVETFKKSVGLHYRSKYIA